MWITVLLWKRILDINALALNVHDTLSEKASCRITGTDSSDSQNFFISGFPLIFWFSNIMHLTMQHFLKKKIMLISSEKSLLGSCQVQNGKYNFSKILMFTWRLEFDHWKQMLSVAFLELIGSLPSFLENVYRIPKSELLVCQWFFQVMWKRS